MAASEPAPAEKKAGDEGEEECAGDDSDAAAIAPDEDHVAGLTDAQLMEVFKQTSIFNVRSALANNDALMSSNEAGDNEERCAISCLFYLIACTSHDRPLSSDPRADNEQCASCHGVLFAFPFHLRPQMHLLHFQVEHAMAGFGMTWS